MEPRLFQNLVVCRDDVFRSAAMNMALDEACLEMATQPVIRFYRWGRPALSFGFFGRFNDVAAFAGERDLVRRWTGGGIVFHGDDLTYCLVVPAAEKVSARSSMWLYEQTHRAIQRTLRRGGEKAWLAPDTLGERSQACFAKPVRADVMLRGKKIAGAAQRRTRHGLIQQGSIQNIRITPDFAERFAGELAGTTAANDMDATLLARGVEIAQQKYGTSQWLERR